MSEVLNIDGLTRKLSKLQRDVMPTALAQAINRVAGTVRTRTTRSVAKATGLKQAPIRRRVVITRKATKTSPEAELRIKGRPLNLIEFKPTPKTPEASQRKRKGIRTSAWGSRRLHREAFIARMPNGSVIVVKRSAAGKRGKKIRTGKWANRSPHIEAMFGPGIANTAAEQALRAERRATIDERLPIELKRALKFRISRLLVK